MRWIACDSEIGPKGGRRFAKEDKECHQLVTVASDGAMCVAGRALFQGDFLLLPDFICACRLFWDMRVLKEEKAGDFSWNPLFKVQMNSIDGVGDLSACVSVAAPVRLLCALSSTRRFCSFTIRMSKNSQLNSSAARKTAT